MSSTPDTAPTWPSEERETAIEWRCFHCDEVFTRRQDAIEHFGPPSNLLAGRFGDAETACQLKGHEHGLLGVIRRQEEELRGYRNEDGEITRAMFGMQSDHAAALRREEEAGYAKGLADGMKRSVATPPAPAAGEREVTGTMECPVCGHDRPHWHDPDTVRTERDIRPAFEAMMVRHFGNPGGSSIAQLATYIGQQIPGGAHSLGHGPRNAKARREDVGAWYGLDAMGRYKWWPIEALWWVFQQGSESAAPLPLAAASSEKNYEKDAVWFIERTQTSTGYNASYPGSVETKIDGGLWYQGEQGEIGHYTNDPTRAIRFSRKVDAEAVIRAKFPGHKYIATEHLFMDLAAPAPLAAEPERKDAIHALGAFILANSNISFVADDQDEDIQDQYNDLLYTAMGEQ